ncbi:MAG: hypothetical protein HY906_05490 [Deltaproteobacteria bacterium]|nr:hypothetical protein [Deltaproteobacteria bacterium]
MSNRSLALLLGSALLAVTLGCGPSGPERRPRSADDEEKQSRSDARMGPLRTVWDYTPKFKECYDEARRVHSDLVLRATIDIEVDGKWRVTRTYLSTAKPIDDSLKKCLLRVAEGIVFPASGESFKVRPAIVFQP